MNYSNDTDECEGEGVHIFSLYETIFWFAMYCAIAILSFAGNALVVTVILSRKHLRNVTNYFILNLALADAITGVLGIPFKFQAALLQRWDLPAFMCKLVPFVETVSMSVSVVVLTCIAIDRFVFVIFPKVARPRLRTAKILLAVIWGFGVVISVPYAIGHKVIRVPDLEGNETIPICVAHYGNSKSWKIYNIYLIFVQYCVPVVVISGAYLCIALKLWMAPAPSDRSEEQRQFEQSKRRVVKMLIIVVCMFTFCWLPLETYFALAELLPCINAYEYINVVFFCCHWLAMSNSALNPIIYGVYNKKFRQEYAIVFHRLRGLGACRGRRSSHGGQTLHLSVLIRLHHQQSGGTNIFHSYMATELGHD